MNTSELSVSFLPFTTAIAGNQFKIMVKPSEVPDSNFVRHFMFCLQKKLTSDSNMLKR